MRDVMAQLLPWWESERSGRRRHRGGDVPVRAASGGRVDARRPEGEAVGSVSGGCVEGAVYELAQQVLGDRPAGAPALRRQRRDAFAVGLTCGGILDVFVEVVDKETFPELGAGGADDRRRRAGRGRDRRRARGSRPGSAAGWSIRPEGHADAGRRLRSGPTGPTTPSPPTLGACSPPVATRPCTTVPTVSAAVRAWRSSWRRTPRSRGCSSSARSTSPRRSRGSGSFLGYHVTVCDARPVFATATGSPRPTRSWSSGRTSTSAEEVEAGRVDERTVICVLTHDPKFDVPVLEVALRLPRSPTSARWARAAPTTTGSSGCGRPA